MIIQVTLSLKSRNARSWTIRSRFWVKRDIPVSLPSITHVRRLSNERDEKTFEAALDERS